jgi:hypothetical protein
VWIGAGPRPAPGAAHHVLWLDDPDGTAVHDGSLVLLYHLLWELTHVCFEHPGLVAHPVTCEDEASCITCSDEGRPAEVVSTGAGGEATVRTARGVEHVDATIVEPLHAGELVLVHAGAVLARLEEPE